MKVILAVLLSFAFVQCGSTHYSRQQNCRNSFNSNYNCGSPYNHYNPYNQHYRNQYFQRSNRNAYQPYRPQKSHNPLYVPKSRYNNLTRPGKWKL
ncbi:MAG: hypothetical protein GW761_07310 [Leptospira sp.]|nr:hypothetical protein [Leptospira sp.]